MRFGRSRFAGGICLAAIILTASAGLAQCGDTPPDSTCYQCHLKEDPVFGNGEWHDIHARKDCCWYCHGGNSTAMDKDQAHIGMLVNPLVDAHMDCYPCHPTDYGERAERFGALLGITVGGLQPPGTSAAIITEPREENALIILEKPGRIEQKLVPIELLGPLAAVVLVIIMAVLASKLQADPVN